MKRTIKTFRKLTDECREAIRKCDHMEQTVRMRKSTRRPDPIWIMDANGKPIATVSEAVAKQLTDDGNLDHHRAESVDYSDTGRDVWYPVACESCDQFYKLDGHGFCQACEEQCELCEDRFPHEDMETDNVCRRCAEAARSTRRIPQTLRD